MTPRTRNLGLLVLGLPALVTPWVPFIEIGGAADAVRYAFVDFLDTASMELPANEVAHATCADNVPTEPEPGCADLCDRLESSARWRERLHDIVLSLPIFMPFLILYRQVRSLVPPQSMSRQSGRLAVTLASAWLAYFTATSLWQLPGQLLVVWSLSQSAQSLYPLAEQVPRMAGLFGSIAAGAWLLERLWRRSGTLAALDSIECACMVVYIVAVVPELVTDGLGAASPGSTDRLLLGYALLLWTCMVYAVTLAVRFREQRLAA
jgi:hypothetical protein